MEFSHVGMITTEPKPGEVFVEATRVWITNFVDHPHHVEWLRFEPDSPVTGPVRYSMTATEAVELCALLEPETAVPVHFEGWSHFHEGRSAIEATVARAPGPVRDRFRFATLGEVLDLEV